MNVTVTAQSNGITVSGKDPTRATDTVQVVINVSGANMTVVNNQFQNVPANTLESQFFSLDPGTYDVNVYFNNLQSVSTFTGITVPPSQTGPLTPNQTIASSSPSFPKPPTPAPGQVFTA